MHRQRLSLLLLMFKKVIAFPVGALLGMLSAMNAEKRGSSRKFASKSNRSRNLTTSAALLPKHCIASVVGALSCLPPAVVDDIDNEMTRTVNPLLCQMLGCRQRRI